MDLADWLKTIGLERHAAVFAENDVDLDTLPHLTDEDLRELGLSLGHRRKLAAALRDAVGESAEDPETGAGAEAERRQLTVMFCDLAGSTELSERLDPEELRDVMRRYHETVAEAVAAQEGHVAKLLGDGVLAYFGWPRAHEAQAERAVRAALAAVAAVGQAEAAGGALSARAGIATGPVVIGDIEGPAGEAGAISGATPNLAARLQGLARPGEVVIHAATRRLIGEAFAMEEAGEHRLKGFADSVAVWRVLGSARSESRFEAMHGAALIGFVGRGPESDLMADRWRRAQGGDGQAVLIVGEAGIGKSRFLREFTAGLARDVQMLRCQCSPHEVNTAFHPLIAEIETTAGLRPDDPPERRLDRLEAHLADTLDATEEALALFAGVLSLPADRYPPVGMAPQRRRQRTVELLAARILGLARARPTVLIVEDVHWIDHSSHEVLDVLLPQLRGRTLLVLMSTRPDGAPRWPGLGHVATLSLDRLGADEVRVLAERVAGGRALPGPLLERIVEHTDGVPLFVEELTKTVLEAGILDERPDRYELAGPLPALAIPTTLQDSLMARLDRLAPVRRVVQAGACIGREFDAGLLAEALSMERNALDAALGRLVAAELIFRRGGGDGDRYVFKHALVQDAAYSSLLLSARRTLHERLARALERREGAEPLELARHFAGAGANARAAELYLLAGRRALTDSALPEATGALELGLAAVEALPAAAGERERLELDLRVALGAARMASFGWAHRSVAGALEPAFPLARRLGDDGALGSILWGLWVHYQTRAEFPRAHEWLDELRSAATGSPDSDLPVIHDMSAGCQHFWEADYARAVSHTDHLKTIYVRERHAPIAAMANHDPMVFAQHWAGSLADWIRGRPDRSIERMEEALDLARAIGHPFNLVFALTAGSTCLVYLGLSDRLAAHCDEAGRVARDEALGPFAEHVLEMQWRGAACVQAAEFGRGLDLARRGYEFWSGSGGGICTAMFRSWIALGLQGLGQIGEAVEIMRDNIGHCRRTGDRYMEPECLRMLGELELAGTPSAADEARRLFGEALELARAHGALSWELRAAMSLARLHGAEGRRDEAARVLEPVLGRFGEGGESADLRAAEALLSTFA